MTQTPQRSRELRRDSRDGAAPNQDRQRRSPGERPGRRAEERWRPRRGHLPRATSRGERTTAVRVVSPSRRLYQKLYEASGSIIRQYGLTAAGGARARLSEAGLLERHEGKGSVVQTSIILAGVVAKSSAAAGAAAGALSLGESVRAKRVRALMGRGPVWVPGYFPAWRGLGVFLALIALRPCAHGRRCERHQGRQRARASRR